MLATLPFPELEISDIGRTSRCVGQQIELLLELGKAASMLRFFQERVPIRSCSDSTANSEGDSSFQELCSRQSSRSNQILTVKDMASMRGRSYEICITSGRHIFGPRLTFTCKNMIETDLSEGN